MLSNALTWYRKSIDFTRPRARAVVLFAGLGIIYTLVQVLVVPSYWADTAHLTRWPLSQPLALTLRLWLAALSFAVVVWAVRPGARSRAEQVFLLGVALLYSVLVSITYQPAMILVVVPVVMRYWWSLRRTLLSSVLLTLATLTVYLLYPDGWHIKSSEDVQNTLQFLVLTVAQGAFSYSAFELTLRREEDRTELRAALGELREYHGLELQHAALEERARLSRELHDTLGHHLTALRLEVQRARRLQGSSEALSASLERALARSGESMNDLQAAVRALRPVEQGGTLQGAVDDLVRAWPADVHLRYAGPEPMLSATQRLTLYRCVQEGLTNAQKHAPGQPVTVELSSVPDGYEVRVSHQVASLPVSGARDAGNGLHGLRARLRELGGSLSAQREENAFELRAFLPLEEE